MIRTKITADFRIAAPVALLDDEGREHQFTAIMDTGFDGFLTLPRSTIVALGLNYYNRSPILLGDGSEAWLRKYEAAVLWDDEERDILVVESESQPLMGLSLLRGHRVCFDLEDGGAVTIQPL